MLEYVHNFRVIAEHCIGVKAGEQILILADETARATLFGQVLRDVINSMGAEATLMIIKEREHSASEPCRAASAAMLNSDAVVHVSEKLSIGHTNARMNATAAGIRYSAIGIAPEEYFKKPVQVEDYDKIEKRTEKLAKMLTDASVARVTSLGGTDITMSLKGRTAKAVHPKSKIMGAHPIPGHGEATLAPVEGTAEGVVVVDLRIDGLAAGLLRQPVRWIVKKGRIIDFVGPADYVEWLRQTTSTDEGANVICQLAIGTSHLIPKVPTGNHFDAGKVGRVHMAFGRNNDFGGTNFSLVHVDGLFGGTTVELDGRRVVENEELLF